MIDTNTLTVSDSHTDATSTVFADDLAQGTITVPSEILDAVDIAARGPVRCFLDLAGHSSSVDLIRRGDVLHGLNWPLEVFEGAEVVWIAQFGGCVLTLVCP
jgi:hypothetical protein